MAESPSQIHLRVRWDRLSTMFDEQRQLQIGSYGADPGEIDDPEERIQFIKDMAYALEDELHEFTNEVGWKPWATSRHVNEAEAQGELVDLFHFFMNLAMAVHLSPEMLFEKYMEKRKRNAERQLEGYDGIQGKCYACKRALDDLAQAWGLPLGRVFAMVTYVSSEGHRTKKEVPICTECGGGTVIVDD